MGDFDLGDPIELPPIVYSFWVGILSGIFLASGLHPHKELARAINEMLDTLYSLIPTDKVSFPIFWYKVLIWLLLVTIPAMKTKIIVALTGVAGIAMFLVGILSGYLLILNIDIGKWVFVGAAIVAFILHGVYGED